MGIGQRYDITLDANQPLGNYWFNVTFSNTGACGTSRNPKPAAIFHYNGAPNANPTVSGTLPTESLCADTYGFTPVVTRTAPLTQFNPVSNNLPVTFDVQPAISKVFWKVNGSAIDVQWEKPTLQYVLEGNTSYPTNLNLITLPLSNVVSSSLPLCQDLLLSSKTVERVAHPEHLTNPSKFLLHAAFPG